LAIFFRPVRPVLFRWKSALGAIARRVVEWEILVLFIIFLYLPIPQLDGSRVIFPFLPSLPSRILRPRRSLWHIIALLFVSSAFPVILIIEEFCFKLIVG